jgi:hypothetical protein
MINLSQGEYIVFIDDDDRISEDYVSEIMTKLYENPDADCVVFDTILRLDGGEEKLCTHGIEYEYEYGYSNKSSFFWTGKPAHTMVYASNIVKRHEYTDVGCGEDFNWVKRAYLDIKNQIRINKVLYYYDSEGSTLSEMSGISDEVILENVNKRLNN